MNKAPLLFEDRPSAAPGPTAPHSVARGVTLVVLIFLATRLVTWTGAYLGAATVFCIRHQWEPPLAKHRDKLSQLPLNPDSPEYRSAQELLLNFAPLAQFDGHNYKSIIEHGYQYRPLPPDAAPRARQQNIAFFPLYPLLCRPLATFMTTEAAMILFSHVCALAAAIVLYLWVRRRIDENAALFAVAAVFCLPAACYYSFAYAESLTLFLLVIALWLMDRGVFVPTTGVCALAAATRPTALAIVPVFMLAYWFNSSIPPRRRLPRLVPLTLLAAAGVVAYAAYLTWRFGSPLVYFANFEAGWVSVEARADWLEFLTLTPLWAKLKYFIPAVTLFPVGLIELLNPLTWNVPFTLFILFLSLAGLGRVPRSFRPLLLLGPLICVHSYIASGGASFGIDPIARYMAVSVPALVVLAAWCTHEWRAGARCALLAFMLLLQAAWAFRFGLREWSG